MEIREVSSTEDDGPPATSMLDKLQPHILVNSIGDYYDVPKLKQKANEHIRNVLENSWSARDITAAAELAFSSTSDTELYMIITTAVNGHIQELIDREDFLGQELLNPFSTGIIQDLLKKLMTSELKAKESDQKIVMMERSNALQEIVYERRISGLEDTIEKLKDAIGISNSRDNCRHCGRDWHSYIDRSSCKVRCGRCGTRHPS